MRYIDFMFGLLMINLSLSLFANSGLVPTNNMYVESTENITGTGEVQNVNTSMAYKIKHWSTQDGIRKYLNAGVQDDTQQYLQSGGDFIRGLYYFYDVFLKGSVILSPTLENFGVPKPIAFYFDIPLYFMYTLALIQLISGRNLRGMA